MSGPTACVLLAPGTEEMECVIVVDVLRRAGVEVTLAGLEGEGPHSCSRGVSIVPDASLSSVVSAGTVYSCLVLPGGGPGAKALGESQVLGQLLAKHESQGKLIAAVCAGPTALAKHGVGKGKRVTTYPAPAFKDAMEAGGYVYVEENVVEDGSLITSRGPGTTFTFAIAIARQLVGQEVADNIAKAMLL